MPIFYIYILQSSTSSKFYVGYSSDPWKRVIEHNTVDYNTYTSKHRPWELKAVFRVGDCEGTAMQLEKFIKNQKSKKLIIKLIDPLFIPESSLALLARVPHARIHSREIRDLSEGLIPHVRDEGGA